MFCAPARKPRGSPPGAQTIRQIEAGTYNFPATETASAFSLQPFAFAFDFSGYAFGRFVTDSLTQGLIASGELPPETQLELADAYKKMAGTGQIWIDETGYPIRILLDLDLGQQETGETMEAVIDINYDDFAPPVINPTAVWFTPQVWLQDVATQNPALPNQLALSVALVLFSLALAVLIRHTWHTRAFYNSIAGSITILMVAGPLLQVGRAEAYNGRIQHRLDAADAQAQEVSAEDTFAEYQAEQQD